MKRKLVSITARLKRERPDIDPSTIADLIEARRVFAGGAPVSNPRALVPHDVAIVVQEPHELRGTRKLRAALERFTPQIEGKIALDLGASTGGFTVALLDAGAGRVYAVDAGFGQLKGSLRLDARVVNLERTNLGALDRAKLPDAVDVVVADLSYVSLAKAFAQLDAPDKVAWADGATALALVKPMFELGLDHAPLDDASLDLAVARASAGLDDAGWDVAGSMRSPFTGARGAVEGWVYARRRR